MSGAWLRWPATMAAIVLVVVFVPARLRSPERRPDMQAIAGLRELASAEVEYAASCGNGGYATSLDVLLAAAPGRSAFLSRQLVGGMSTLPSGAVITLGPGLGSTDGPTDCLGRTTGTGYYATAVPRASGAAAARAFAMRTDGVVWQVSGPAAPTEPFAAPATPIR